MRRYYSKDVQSTTFVCLFPRAIEAQDRWQHTHWPPYIPLGIGLLIIVGSPLVLVLSQGRILFLLVEPLTTRELEVLHLIVQGVRNVEIAQRLFISVKTVETHLTSLYGKLGVQSRAEVIALAQHQGLLLEEGK